MIRFLHISNMRNSAAKALFLLFCLLFSAASQAQCPVKASVSKVDIMCGDTVKLSATGTPGVYIFTQDFNTACPGTNWAASSSADCSNPCGPGPGGSADPHLWMSSAATAPRLVMTNNYDLSPGGTICFDMRYAEEEPQEGCGATALTCNCEGPDLPDEGVHLQYSNNNGATWIEIQYWDPNGGHDPSLVKWNNHCVTIPPGAMTTSTRFRWYQTASSDNSSDHWGIDNVKISLNDPNYKYDWLHDGLAPATTSTTPPVTPSANTTYTVTYSDGAGNSCSASVSVNVTLPTATATISPALLCKGAVAQLNVETSYKYTPPTSCGASSAACNSMNSKAGEYTVGTGNIVNSYNSTGPEVFGDFGDAHIRSQILYRASELIAAGFKGGKFTNIQFDVARIDESASSPFFTVSMKCTNLTTITAFQSGLTTVYNTKAFTAKLGWNTITFDQAFDWDGVSNIIVEICSYVASGESASTANWGVFTRDHNPGYNAWRQAGTNFSDANCTLTSFETSYSQRPNTRFGVCEPRNVTLSYNWGGSGLSSTTAQKPTATVTSSGNYTVTVYPQATPQCSTIATVPVTVAEPIASINPNPATVCPPGNPNVVLTGSGTTNGSGTFGVAFSNTASLAIPDNNTTGITRTINVTGITPATLSAGMIASVCLNITHPDVGDLQVSLTSPSGNVINLYNQTVANGSNFTNTCFVTGGLPIGLSAAPFTGSFSPVQAYTGLTGNVNGTWTITVKDLAKPITGATAGTYQNATLTLNHTGSNFITGYAWSPPAGLSATNTSSPTASPTVSTTYTLTITDAQGCTGTQTVAVGYCATVPAEIVSFDAFKLGNDVEVKWTTATQLNTFYFAVERSSDGISFEELGRVEGAGSYTGRKNYSFTDGNPGRINMYRLRSVDYNGDYQYSPLKQVEFDMVRIVNIYPNPIREEINYDVFLTDIEKLGATIEVVDLLGQVKYTEEIVLKEGENRAKAILGNLPSGAYTIRIKNKQETIAYKTFIKA